MAILDGETGGIKVHLSDLVEAFCHQFREHAEEDLKKLDEWQRRDSVWTCCSSVRSLFVRSPTNNRSTRYPFVATRQVSSAPRRRACEIGDRWPLQDWTIGPCCLRNQPPSRPFSRIVLTNEVEMLIFKNTHKDAK